MRSLAMGKPERFENGSGFPRLQAQLLASALQEIVHAVCKVACLNRGVFFPKVNDREKCPKDRILFGIQMLLWNSFATPFDGSAAKCSRRGNVIRITIYPTRSAPSPLACAVQGLLS